MDTNWRDRAKQVGGSVSEVSKKAKQQIQESAPDVSRRVQQQIKETAPVVTHRAREVRNALTASVTPPAAAQQPPAATPLPPSVDGQYEITRSPSGSPTQAQFGALPPVIGTSPAISATAPAGQPSAGVVMPVRVAYVALLIAAVASLVLAGMGVYGLTQLQGTVDTVLKLEPTGAAAVFANGYVDSAATYLTSAAVALGVVFALAYFLVAHAVRRGHRWPRTVGSALAVLSLPALFFGPAAVIAVLAGIVAVLALWTPAARQYALGATTARPR